MEFLENKTIFVIGALGFLGKIMVEKILRVQPNVKKLYLLLRSVDEITATKRFYDEVHNYHVETMVVEKDLFRLLKEKWSGNLDTFISERISLVHGDVACPNMGLKDSNLLKEMKNQVEIIINLAATTNFDERYDVAFGTNTLGAKHVLSFAKKCSNLKVLIHISTGERKGGLILETPCKLDESSNKAIKLDIEIEQKVIEETLNEFRNKKSTEETITLAMKDLGLKRAMIYGCPNTYTFTKAMGEMMVSDEKDGIPLIIIRPTIVTSTYKEPFPGWIEGLRTIDSFIAGYAKGKVTCFPCDDKSILDLIPADMVINAIIMAIVTHMFQPSNQTLIYHVGSSTRNSIRHMDFHNYLLRYFTKKPWINKDGSIIQSKKITLFNDMESFHRYMTLRYLIFLKGLEFVNKALCYSFQDTYIDLQRKFNWVMRQIELYRPYLFFKSKFDDTNFEKLRIATQECDRNAINTLFMDPKDISWEDYFVNIHIPGLIKHVLK